MRNLFLLISLLSVSTFLLPAESDARGSSGQAHHAAASHVFYANGSAANPIKGPLPTGSNGYAYRPVGAGYWGRRGRGWGGYGGYGGGYFSAGGGNYFINTMKPVDNSYDEFNRAHDRRLGSLPASAFVHDYSWGSGSAQQQPSNSQLATSGNKTH